MLHYLGYHMGSFCFISILKMLSTVGPYFQGSATQSCRCLVLAHPTSSTWRCEKAPRYASLQLAPALLRDALIKGMNGLNLKHTKNIKKKYPSPLVLFRYQATSPMALLYVLSRMYTCHAQLDHTRLRIHL